MGLVCIQRALLAGRIGVFIASSYRITDNLPAIGPGEFLGIRGRGSGKSQRITGTGRPEVTHPAAETQIKTLDITVVTAEKKQIEGVIKGKGQKVLIVDDEIDTLKPMEDMLESLGYLTASAGNSYEAIEKYNAWKPSVVLMDRNMPEMDGMKAAKIIIENDAKANIVLISGYEADGINGILEEDKRLIRNYLTKPIDVPELSRVLAEILEKG